MGLFLSGFKGTATLIFTKVRELNAWIIFRLVGTLIIILYANSV